MVDLRKEEKIKELEKLFRKFLEVFDIDLTDDNFRDTPKRMARMYVDELLVGLNEPNFKITTFDNPGYDQIIAEAGIPFYSLCAHHFLPFFGIVDIAYLPNERIIGLSKLDRIVKHFSRKPQIQESMTNEIADYIMDALKPKGTMVIVRARHLCKEMRGAKSNGTMITSAVRGCFRDDSSIKEEALVIFRGLKR